MRRIGVGYRHGLARWIDGRPPELGCLEITAEHFFDQGKDRLKSLADTYPVFVHGLGLSLGTPGPLDNDTLQRFVEVVKISNPLWVSEHIAFTRTAEVDLGHLNPVRPTIQTQNLIVEHAREMADACQKPLILENITSNLRMEGDLSETEFLNKICREAGCGLLLDVTNLMINSRNHHFDPRQWLSEIEPKTIVQLHVVGYAVNSGRLEDSHCEPIQEDLLALLKDVIDYAPVQAIILERDSKLENVDAIRSELRKLEAVIEPR